MYVYKTKKVMEGSAAPVNMTSVGSAHVSGMYE